MPSSRTPEGEPAYCEVCRRATIIEPSRPPGDATCPFCGSIIWFEPRLIEDVSARDAAGRTIGQLVTEIAVLCAKNPPQEELLRGFLERLVQALAAIGGAIWHLPKNSEAVLLTQCGNVPSSIITSTGHQDAVSLAANEARLILPENTNQNPPPVLLVLAPVRAGGKTGLIVEVFQRPGANAITQRGYLRFTTQMCEILATAIERPDAQPSRARKERKTHAGWRPMAWLSGWLGLGSAAGPRR